MYEEFLKRVKEGKNEQYGWTSHAYGKSKLFLNLYTYYWAKTEELKKTGVTVVSFCPGWVRTDLGGSNADLSID